MGILLCARHPLPSGSVSEVRHRNIADDPLERHPLPRVSVPVFYHSFVPAKITALWLAAPIHSAPEPVGMVVGDEGIWKV